MDYIIETFEVALKYIRNSPVDQLFSNARQIARNLKNLATKIQNFDSHSKTKLQGLVELIKKQIIIKFNMSQTKFQPISLKITIQSIQRKLSDAGEISQGNSNNFQLSENSIKLIKGNFLGRQISAAKRKYMKQLRAQHVESAQTSNQQYINLKIYEISRGNERVSGTGCLMCLEVLREGDSLAFLNKYHTNCLTVSSNQLFDKDLLQKYINSLANQNFGLIMGPISTQNNQQIQGYSLTRTQKDKLIKLTACISKRITPAIKTKIDFIPVKQNIFDTKPANKNKFCVRIAIEALYLNRLHSIKFYNLGYEPIQEFYKLSKGKPKLMSLEEICPTMLANYNYKIKEGFRDFGVELCRDPFEQDFNQDQMSIVDTQGAYLQQKLESLMPKFQFAYASLMIVGSEKKTLFIKKFCDTLTKQKKHYSIQKVFEPLIKKCGRKILFLSHEDKHSIIKQMLNTYDKGKNIRFIPLQKCMRIQASKMNQYHLEQLKNQYLKVFPEKQDGYELFLKNAEMSNGEYEQCYFLKFNDFSCVVLGYIILEVLGIKPFVLKYVPGYGNSKKGKDFIQ